VRLPLVQLSPTADAALRHELARFAGFPAGGKAM